MRRSVVFVSLVCLAALARGVSSAQVDGPASKSATKGFKPQAAVRAPEPGAARGEGSPKLRVRVQRQGVPRRNSLEKDLGLVGPGIVRLF